MAKQGTVDEVAISSQLNQQKNTKRNQLAKSNSFTPVDDILSRRAQGQEQEEEIADNSGFENSRFAPEFSEESQAAPEYGFSAQAEQAEEETDEDYSTDEEAEADEEENSAGSSALRDALRRRLRSPQDEKGQESILQARKNQAANKALRQGEKTAAQGAKATGKIAAQASKAAIRWVASALAAIFVNPVTWVIIIILVVVTIICGIIYYSYENCGWTFYATSIVHTLTGNYEKILNNAVNCKTDNPDTPATTPANSTPATTPKPAGGAPSSGNSDGGGSSDGNNEGD